VGSHCAYRARTSLPPNGVLRSNSLQAKTAPLQVLSARRELVQSDGTDFESPCSS